MTTRALWPTKVASGSTSARERELAAVVDQTIVGHAREGGEAVRRRRPVPDGVPDVDAPREERIGDQLAMAAPGDRLGAEDGGRSLAGEVEQPVELGLELGRLHVVGIGAEGRARPGDVGRVALAVASPAQTGKPGVGDASRREGVSERLAREVRMPARRREATHVGDAEDAVCPHQIEERLGGECRVTERVDDHASTVAQGIRASVAPGGSLPSRLPRSPALCGGAARGLEVLVHVVLPHEALLDLGGVPTVGGALAVRVTVRNHSERAVAIDPAQVELVPADGPSAAPLAGPSLDAALAQNPAAERVRRERLAPARVGANETVTGYAVYPGAAYREARIAIEDAETGETEGFVAPVE